MLHIALLYLILLLSHKLGDVTVTKARDVALYVELLDHEGEGITVLRYVKNCQTNVTESYTKRLKSSAILVRAIELARC
jgi:hypothetical protein